MMTNYFLSAFRSLTKRGRNHGMKILSLGVGLAMGLVLIPRSFLSSRTIRSIRMQTVFIA